MGETTATLPAGGVSPVSGTADPAVRLDPSGSTLWLGYSWLHPATAANGTTVIGAEVDTHLARSDDGGRSWRKVGTLWAAQDSARNASGASGHINSETVALTSRVANGATTWFGARHVYFVPDSGSIDSRSFTIHVSSAVSPDQLGSSSEAVLGGAYTDSYWAPTTNLASLDPAVASCSFYDESLLYRNGLLYMAVQCAQFTQSGGDNYPAEFVAVFSTDPTGTPSSWQWSYRGKLTTYADAVALGGSNLEQSDLEVASDGTLMIALSPSAANTGGNSVLDQHFGCRFLTVTSLDQPAILRNTSGAPVVRASITASDLTPPAGTPASCGYDPGSVTGALIALRNDTNGLRSAIHVTGVRP